MAALVLRSISSPGTCRQHQGHEYVVRPFSAEHAIDPKIRELHGPTGHRTQCLTHKPNVNLHAMTISLQAHGSQQGGHWLLRSRPTSAAHGSPSAALAVLH